MPHPFQSLNPALRRRLLVPLLLLTLALLVFMNWQGAALVTGPAPFGIVSYELARTVEQVQAILNSWDANARLNAAFGLGFDFLFMAVYSSALALACLGAGEVLRQYRWPLAGWGATLAWGGWLAALCDMVENSALLVTLLGLVAEPWPAIAWTAAVIKFALIFLGMVYGIFGWVVGRVSRITAGR